MMKSINYLKLSFFIYGCIICLLSSSCGHGNSSYTNYACIIPEGNYRWQLTVPSTWQRQHILEEHEVYFKIDLDSVVRLILEEYSSEESASKQFANHEADVIKFLPDIDKNYSVSEVENIAHWQGKVYSYVDSYKKFSRFYILKNNNCIIILVPKSKNNFTKYLIRECEKIISDIQLQELPKK